VQVTGPMLGGGATTSIARPNPGAAPPNVGTSYCAAYTALTPQHLSSPISPLFVEHNSCRLSQSAHVSLTLAAAANRAHHRPPQPAITQLATPHNSIWREQETTTSL
jgi:hypothetical protein